MITMVNPIMESLKDAFRFRGPDSVADDLRLTGPTGPFISAAAGYYLTRIITTMVQMLAGTRMGGFMSRMGDAGIGAITGLAQVFLGRAFANQFPTLFARDAFVGGVYVGAFQGVLVPLIRGWAPDNKFLSYLAGAWDTGDFGGNYGAVPSLPMAGAMWQGAYGEQEQPLGTAYYEDTSVAGPVPSGYDNAQLDAGYEEDMLYANM